MIIGIARIKLSANWCHSLKEKRMVVKSIVNKVKHRFNVSIAEIDALDFHQTIILGIACVTNSSKHANSEVQNIVEYIQNNTEAYLEEVSIEIL
jgi:uncharacterized protein YlxP (DUF503 family)